MADKEFIELLERVNIKMTRNIIVQELIKKANTEERIDHSYHQRILIQRING